MKSPGRCLRPCVSYPVCRILLLLDSFFMTNENVNEIFDENMNRMSMI